MTVSAGCQGRGTRFRDSPPEREREEVKWGSEEVGRERRKKLESEGRKIWLQRFTTFMFETRDRKMSHFLSFPSFILPLDNVILSYPLPSFYFCSSFFFYFSFYSFFSFWNLSLFLFLLVSFYSPFLLFFFLRVLWKPKNHSGQFRPKPNVIKLLLLINFLCLNSWHFFFLFHASIQGSSN